MNNIPEKIILGGRTYVLEKDTVEEKKNNIDFAHSETLTVESSYFCLEGSVLIDEDGSKNKNFSWINIKNKRTGETEEWDNPNFIKSFITNDEEYMDCRLESHEEYSSCLDDLYFLINKMNELGWL